MAALKAGDRVKIADRPATPQDLKSGLFFNHYRGLVGVVRKAYKTSEVAVEIEVECLAEDVWKRHMQTRDQMRLRWLEGLTDEARRKLKPEQKSFDLRYVILVSGADLARQKSPRPTR